MTSTRRAEANLCNAARSTGPRTIRGRARASLNAVTHGLTAETLILPGEDPRAFQRRLESWTAALEPANPFEQDLVRQVVTLSWRLDRAERVQDALIADSLGTIPAEEDQRRREEVEDLGRRLLPPPRVPNFVRRFGVWADLDRLAHRGPDDPDDPARLLLRLEATADDCRWLIDRWAELRTVVDAGTAWPDEQMVYAIRLLGKRPHDAVDDLEVLTIFVACFALEPSRPDPFAELWKTTLDREAIRYRERLLGRRLREAKPRSKEHAREVLLDVVDAAVSRLEEQERQNRERERALAALRPEMLLFDASPEGEWVRREQGKATRSILRITERFRKARRRGETLSPPPPKPPRLDPAPIRPIETRPLEVPQERMESPYQRPGRLGGPIPVVIFDHPRQREPREYIGGRSEGRRKEVPNERKTKFRRCSPEKAEQIAIRAIQWLKNLGLALLIVASLGTTAGAPASDRPEGSVHRAQPVLILDGAPGHPLPGLRGPESPFIPLSGTSDPRNGQNEPKDGEVAQDLPARPNRIAHRSDRSRGPPGAGFDRSSADRSPSEPADAGSSPPRGPRAGTVRPGEISSLLSRWWEYPTIARGRATAGLALQVPPPTQGRRPPVPEPQLAGVGLLTTAAGPAGAESR